MTNPNIPQTLNQSNTETVSPEATTEQFETPVETLATDTAEVGTDPFQEITDSPVSAEEFGDALSAIPNLPKYSSDQLKQHLDHIEMDLRYPAELDEQMMAAEATATRPYQMEADRLDSEVAQMRSQTDQALADTQSKYTNTKVKAVFHKLGWGKRKVSKAKAEHAKQHGHINAEAYKNDVRKQELYFEKNRAAQEARSARRKLHDAMVDGHVESATRDLREAQAYEAGSIGRAHDAHAADNAYAEVIDAITKADVDNRIAGTPLDPTEVAAIKDRALLARLKQPLAGERIAEWVRSAKDTPGAVLRREGSATYYAVPKTFKQLGEERFAAKSESK